MDIKIIINKLINFQIFCLPKYFEKNWDKYPIEKKNKNEAKDAPAPKKNLFANKKFLEKFPRKNTVSE